MENKRIRGDDYDIPKIASNSLVLTLKLAYRLMQNNVQQS